LYFENKTYRTKDKVIPLHWNVCLTPDSLTEKV